MFPEFDTLSLTERADILWANGLFLESIEYYGNTVCLYSLDEGFVECCYNQFSNEIMSIQTVDEQGMRKYVSRIVIPRI